MAKHQRRQRSRVYRRGGRYWADFRDFAELGGKLEALRVPGENRATRDPDLAEALAAQRLDGLQKKRAESQTRAVAGLPPVTTLHAFAQEHLIAKKKAGKVTEQWLKGEELRLTRAVAHFGAGRDLVTIKAKDVRHWAEALSTSAPASRRLGRVGRPLGGGSVRQHLNSLSNLYRRAEDEDLVAPGFNPVSALMDKPSAQTVPARWLEVPEAALLLEAAKTYKPKRADVAVPFAYELIATALLTGGRPREVLGLEVEDINLDRKTVTFRPNEWRELKTLTSYRTVPLWPQLGEILKPWLAKRRLAGGRLLFPSLSTGTEQVLTDARKLLDAVGARVGYKARELNLYDCRHTYCAARLQTLDNGAPVSPFTVGRELGHGGDSLVKRVYGHLGTVRHRADAVEYRVRQHFSAKHHDKTVRQWVKSLHSRAA